MVLLAQHAKKTLSHGVNGAPSAVNAYRQAKKSLVDCKTLPTVRAGATTGWLGCVQPPLGPVGHRREGIDEG